LDRNGSKHLAANIPPLSTSTLIKYKSEEYSERTAQPLTDARKAALLDPITTITYALMLVAFAGLVPATNKINFDGTTVEVPDQSKGRKVYIHKRDPVEGPVASSDVQSELGVLIKLMHIVAASGHKGRFSSEFEDLKAGTKAVIKNFVNVTNEVLQGEMKQYWF
jgi:hypothetical protein